MDLHKIAMMARDLMNFHGLHDWHFKFDRSLTRLGLCSHRKKTISLGKHATLVNDEATVRNTCLHEIAHALVGPNEGHGPIWKAKAMEIGCTGERLGKIAIKAPSKASILCKHCMNSWNAYRLSKRYLHNLNQMWHKSCGRISQGQLVLERV